MKDSRLQEDIKYNQISIMRSVNFTFSSYENLEGGSTLSSKFVFRFWLTARSFVTVDFMNSTKLERTPFNSLSLMNDSLISHREIMPLFLSLTLATFRFLRYLVRIILCLHLRLILTVYTCLSCFFLSISSLSFRMKLGTCILNRLCTLFRFKISLQMFY